MEIKAHAKFLRLSPRKARLVVDAIRGMKSQKALATLKVMPKKAAHEIYKVLKSAIANAEHNFGMKKDDLTIKKIVADQGPTFKRFRPRAKGSADTIHKKMTHLLIVLESTSGAKPKTISQPRPELIKETPVKDNKISEKAVKEVKDKPENKDIKETVKKEVEEVKEEKVSQPKAAADKPKAKPPVYNEKGIKKDASFFGGFKSFFRRKDK